MSWFSYFWNQDNINTKRIFKTNEHSVNIIIDDIVIIITIIPIWHHSQIVLCLFLPWKTCAVDILTLEGKLFIKIIIQ